MKFIEFITGIPKTIYFNFSQLPLSQAVKFPIFISRRTKFKSLKGKIYIQGKVRTGQIRIGMDGSGTAIFKSTVIENNGNIILNDGVRIGGGCQICTVKSNSKLEIGKCTKLMGECHLIADKSVKIGCNCAISWNTQIMDTDFHHIIEDDRIVNSARQIEIGDNVWVASNVYIFKGAKIPKNSVIAACSTINGNCSSLQENSVITGLPVRVIKSNIRWEM